MPIIEPDLSRAGRHGLSAAQSAWERAVSAVYTALWEHGVLLEGTVLKCSMVTQGAQSGVDVTPEQVRQCDMGAAGPKLKSNRALL